MGHSGIVVACNVVQLLCAILLLTFALQGVHRAVAADLRGLGKLDILAVSYLPPEHFPQRKELHLDAVTHGDAHEDWTLHPAERETLFLHYHQGHTAEEIGQLTGQPRNTVLSIIHRAIRKLRVAAASDPVLKLGNHIVGLFVTFL